MNDEAPLIELILNADLGMNYQCKTAVQAQGVCTALPATAARSLLTNVFKQWYVKRGREGPGPKGFPDGILRSSCYTAAHLLEAPSTI